MKNISSHYTNDDDRHYRFQRQSGIPLGYFPRKRMDPDRVVYLVCLGIVVLLLVVPL